MIISLRSFVITTLLFCCALKSYAEGSKELSANGGNRAFWRSSTVTTAQFPFPYLGIIKVYVKAGEQIYMGSSAQGIAGGTINWRAPDGSTGTSGNSTTVGRIQDRTEETLGPRLTTNGADPGYNPYIVTATAAQEGVWELTFMPTNAAVAGGQAPLIPANGPWTQNPNSWYIAAFDVTVRDAANTAFLTGRTFLNMFAGITSSVAANFGSFNGIFYVLTRDGYEYTVNANGMQGVAFDFFVNNKGFLDASGNASYKSVPGIGTIPGATIPVHNPTLPDDATNVTHKLFFNDANADLPASAPTVDGQTAWLVSPIIVPTLGNFTFTGTEGTPNLTGTAPLGGSFTFTSTAAGSYRISLDVNQNGIFTDVIDRLLTGFAAIGNNTVAWDAMDGEGNPVPGGTSFLPGSIRIELFSGEVHFPLLDVERNPTGNIVTRVTGLGAPDNILYWDDSDIPLVGTPSNPIRNLDGQNSATNGHSWTNSFGDNHGMDSWSYISSTPLLNTVSLAIAQADLEVVSITPAAPSICLGAEASYQVTVRNNGPNAVTNAPFNFSYLTNLTGVSVTNSVTTGTVTVGSENNLPGAYTASLTMSNGAVIVFTITGTISTLPPANDLTSSASIMRTADVTDPDATNPDATPPADPQAECDAAPSGAGCNNIKENTVTVGDVIAGNTIGAAQEICAGSVPAALTGSVPTGGTGTFTYLWESSTTSSTTGFAAAAGVNTEQGYTPPALTETTWFRRVVNSGCTATSSVIEITVPPAPTAPAVTLTHPTCDVATGTITITVAAGLTYSINGTDYQAGGTFSDIAPGTYQVTARNATGCTSAPTEAIINAQPATPVAPVATPTQPTCDVATGTITVTVVAGLTYSINGTDYQAGNVFSDVTPGTYQVTARSADGCTSTTTEVIINAQPATPAAPVAAPTQPTCDVATGTITVTVVAGLTYSINGTDYQAGGTFSDIAPGTYQVTARNADGCTSTPTEVIINAQPATPVVPAATPTQPTCDVATGTITVTVVAGLTYSINGTDYQAGGTFSDVAPGTYQVTARSADGCTSAATEVIINAQPTTPAAPAATPTQPTCDVATGTITVTVVAGLTYSINGTDYQAGGTFSDIAPGTYQVTARSADGCTSATTEVIINAQPTTPAAPAATPTQPTCDVATGAITVTTVAGLTYSINGTDYQAGGTFSDVAPGTYQVTARNADGCTSAATEVIINAQPATPAAPAATPTQPTCDVATGTITVTTVAGLTYSINGTDYQAGNVFSDVTPGTYQVTARSADGCTSAATEVIINAQPTVPAAPTAAPTTQPTCSAATGTITVTTVAGLTYSINGTDYQAGGTFNDVAPSTYQVTARNADGCTSAATEVIINAQPPAPAAPAATPTQPTCDVATGTITVTLVAGLTYSINGTDYQVGNVFSDVAPGTYQVTARNADGCTSTSTEVTINPQPTAPTAPAATPTQPTCDVATGTITVTAVAGLTYSINGTDYQAGNVFSDVAPGTYQVTARSADGCTSAATEVIINAQPTTPAAPAATPTQPTCAAATGSITVTTAAGLTYSINGTDYQAGNTFDNVAPGTYQVTARNADGCTSASTEVTINPQPTAPAAPTATPTQPTCTAATGTITVTTVAGLTYSINGTDYQAGGTFNGIAPGTYQVTARNPDGCTSAATEVIINAQPTAPAAPGVANITYCQDEAATALTATGTQIKWYTTETGGTALPSPVIPLTTTTGESTYWASQTNAGGCESERAALTVTVQAKPALQVTSSTADMATTDARRELTGNVTGGTFTGPGVVAENNRYYFDPATAGAGLNSITYTSGGNCTSTLTFTIRVIAPAVDLVVSVQPDTRPSGVGDPFNYTITAGNNGPGTATEVVVTDPLPSTVEFISISTNTGTASHNPSSNTVTWNIGTLPPNVINSLTITVRPTQLGIVQNTASIVSTQMDVVPGNNTDVAPKEIVGLKIPNVITPNGDGLNDRFVIKGLELYPQNQLTIINRWGNHVYEKRNYSNDWDGNGLLEGTYFYILELTDNEGKRHDYKGYLMINR